MMNSSFGDCQTNADSAGIINRYARAATENDQYLFVGEFGDDNTKRTTRPFSDDVLAKFPDSTASFAAMWTWNFQAKNRVEIYINM